MTGYVDLKSNKRCVLDNCVKINCFNTTYFILFNGKLYNKKNLQETLSKNNFTFFSDSDEEVLVKAFVLYGYNVFNYLDGVFSFAIWDCKKCELLLGRDHFGVKPLYYSIENRILYFSSSIKLLFDKFRLRPIVDEQSIGELFGLGPAHTQGISPFKNILEIKPANYAVFNNDGLHISKYWELQSKPHDETLEETCDNVKNLLESAIKKQLCEDLNICTMLSGGLDSSIITAYANKYKKTSTLKTFSVDYLDNDKNFIKSDFQPNSDNYYITIMKNKYKTKHKQIVIDTPELAKALKQSMLLRGYPGMADVDSSLFLFCNEIKKDCPIAISGECSDEVFGGYPWFFREDSLSISTFPWSRAISERRKLLNSDISMKLDLEEYINFRYKESISEVNIIETDSIKTATSKKITHLTFNWFMQTLLDRANKMSNGLEIRVPFCDYKLIEYVWNIPWEMKSLGDREKGLLRYIMKDVLPNEIVERKKSPYPKTHNPTYLNTIKKMLEEIINDNNSPIHSLIDTSYVKEIINTNGKNFINPWFGQLMTGPQLMAYLCQLNMWLEEFNPLLII